MFVTRVLSRNEIVLEIQGDILLQQIEEFQKQLDALMERGHQTITLDFARLKTSIHAASARCFWLGRISRSMVNA